LAVFNAAEVGIAENVLDERSGIDTSVLLSTAT
jgi:hypothetical protein